MNNIDWDLIRAFLAVARLGSLSAAARELQVSQPTLSRTIQALETTTRLHLFHRTPRGLELTEQGRTLMESAGAMEQAAERFDRQVSGLSEELRGDVRISANDIVGTFLLPPALKALREAHPGLQLELVLSNQASNLNKREADIALRMFRPTQADLVARRLPDMELGFYAHRDYLAAHGAPQSFEEFLEHDIIGMDEAMDFIEGGRQLGVEFLRSHFALRTDALVAGMQLCRAGAGISGIHVGLAHHWPELVRILERIPLPPLEFWLVCHHDVQFNSRIRAVMAFLGDWFAEDPYRHALV